MKHLNIEIKARCADHGPIRTILTSHKAKFKGVYHQIDTYFQANTGRLKLREVNGEQFLVFYEREEAEGPKQSDVTLFKSDPASSLKEILRLSLGVLVTVDKQREVYLVENVTFHLDTVEDLGAFVEIEVTDDSGVLSKEALMAQCQAYLDLFGIQKEDLLSVSYSDLLLEKM